MLLAAASAHAQGATLLGRVANAGGDPIPGAHVVLVETPYGDVTSQEGDYRIGPVPPGTYGIRVSAIGWTPSSRRVDLLAGEATRVDVILEPATLEAEEVIVTAARRAQATSTTAATVSILSARDIQRYDPVRLDEALRYVPGIQLAGNQVNIRGSSGFTYNTGSRVLLLVDGMPMLRPDAEGIPFDVVPMHRIERIEVLKGPGSALYGTGALGGIIHLITRSHASSPETAIQVHAGTYQPVRYRLWRNQWEQGKEPRPYGGFAVSHGRPLGSHAGFWSSLTYYYDAGHLNRDRRQNLQSFSKFTWRTAPDARLNLLVSVNRRTSDGFIYWNGARDALNPGRIEIGGGDTGLGASDSRVHEFSLQPSYTDVLTPKVLLTTRARAFGVLIQPLDENRSPRPISMGTAGFRYGGEVQIDYEPNLRRHLIIGVSGDANTTRASLFSTNDPLSQPEAAAFVQWEETLGRRITLTGGFRFDSYRIRRGVVERKLSPRATAALGLGKDWMLRIAWGQGFRVPSVAERFVENDDFLPIVSNLDLKPETSNSYEFGLRKNRSMSILGSPVTVTLDGALFRSAYRNLIEPVFVARERSFRFVNLTRGRVQGAELALQVQMPRDRASIHAGYTWLDADDLDLNEPLAFRSKHLLKAGASVTIGPIEPGVDIRLASATERTSSDMARFVQDAQLATPTRVVDLRAAMSLKWVRVALHVRNALDYYYVERPALLAPPRHAMLRISTRW